MLSVCIEKIFKNSVKTSLALRKEIKTKLFSEKWGHNSKNAWRIINILLANKRKKTSRSIKGNIVEEFTTCLPKIYQSLAKYTRFYKQHFYKHHSAEMGKKLSNTLKLNHFDFKTIHFLHPRYYPKGIVDVLKNVQKINAPVLI